MSFALNSIYHLFTFKKNIMKKIFTLAIVSLFTITMFAAAPRPSVTLTTNKKYEVVIDGRSYGSAIGNSMNVQVTNNGRHTIKVYALKNGLFSKQKRLVSTSSFQVSRNDINISVDRNGQINVQEERSYGRNDRDNKGWGNDRNDKGWSDSRNDKKRF
jgi:hypothetical protein